MPKVLAEILASEKRGTLHDILGRGNKVGILGTARRQNYVFAVEGPSVTQPENIQPAPAYPHPCSCTFHSLHSLNSHALVRW